MKEKDFWNWFALHSNSFYYLEENNPQELFSMLAIQLSDIHPDITFEFSSVKDNNKRELVISAGGSISAFPHVKNLVLQAPQMDDWEIIAFKQRKNGFNEVSIGGYSIALDDIFFDYELHKNKIDLALYLKDYQGEPIFHNAVFLFLDRLLGEYDMETKIGRMEIKNIENRSDTSLTLIDLPMIVDEYFKRAG